MCRHSRSRMVINYEARLSGSYLYVRVSREFASLPGLEDD